MRKWTKTAALIMAVSAVYSDSVILAASTKKTSPTKQGKTAAALVATPSSSARTASGADSRVSELPAKPATKPTTEPTTTPADPFETAPSGTSLATTDVNVSDAGTVEIHVNDANLVEVLRMLSLQSQRNIIASKDVRGTVTANLYDVTVREALDAILKANGYGYREKGNFIYVYTAKELDEMEKAERKPVTEIFRLYYTPAANVFDMLKPVLSSEGQIARTTPAKNGIESDGKDIGGDSHATEDILVVTDYPDRMEQVRRIIREVDRRPQQVLIEAVILRAVIQEGNELGIDFTAVGGVDFSSLSAVGSAANSAGSGVDQALTGQIINNPAAGGINDSGLVAGRAGGSGLKLGIVKNNIGVFINALEGITDTVVLANPKVLVLNKQKGEVHVGSEQGYRTTVSTEVLAAEDVKFLETGTRLIFRPYIGDSGYIRLEVTPEDSSGSVNGQGLPNKFVTKVTTNVMVRDGHTIVIGGLFRESTDISRNGVPGLQHLPGVGPLFRSQKDNTTREEVIILLTPHIVKDMQAYAEASEEELKGTEQVRVGMRRGMMPWGRERLAETAYEKAVAEMAKPHPDRNKALWHLEAATNLNPKFREAISLRTRLSGEEVTSVDNSSVRSFIRRQIMAEKSAAPTTQFLPEVAPTPAAPATPEPMSLPPAEGSVKAPAAAPAEPPAQAVPQAAMEPVDLNAPQSMPQPETPVKDKAEVEYEQSVRRFDAGRPEMPGATKPETPLARNYRG